MNEMMQIMKDLTPLRRVFCSNDYDKSVEYLSRLLPFQVHSYASKDETKGWTIPPKSEILEAKILKNGKFVYDGLHHPLAVISLSKGFRGKVSLSELKRHLYYDRRMADAIPYHFRQQYRSWERDWGFAVTKIFFDGLDEGEYEVILDTKESEGALKVMEMSLRGRYGETFVFVAHLDHPGMANDDLAGCAVAVELFKRLSSKKTKYSYKLLLVPEIVGSEYYMTLTNLANREHIIEALFLEMLGSRTPLSIQHSLHGKSNLEEALADGVKSLKVTCSEGPFKSIICNDESIWEAYDIPMSCLSRYPYPEYHTHLDDLSIIAEESLEESVELLWRAVESLEKKDMIYKKFEGTVCLANPKYDLYVDQGQPAFGDLASEEKNRLRLLMDMIPTLRQPVTVKSLAEKVGLGESIVADYLKKWEAKKLLEIR